MSAGKSSRKRKPRWQVSVKNAALLEKTLTAEAAEAAPSSRRSFRRLFTYDLCDLQAILRDVSAGFFSAISELPPRVLAVKSFFLLARS
jgi:hypothetical protein